MQFRTDTSYHTGLKQMVRSRDRTLCQATWAAHSEAKDRRKEVYTFLLAYHSTPHSVTGCSPAELLFSRQLHTKLPEVSSIISSSVGDAAVRQRDFVQKEKGRQAADKRRAAVDSMIQAGDCVLLKQPKKEQVNHSIQAWAEPCCGEERIICHSGKKWCETCFFIQEMDFTTNS